jgi:hypothetical protein
LAGGRGADGDHHAQQLQPGEPLVEHEPAEYRRRHRAQHPEQRHRDRRQPVHPTEPEHVRERGVDQGEVQVPGAGRLVNELLAGHVENERRLLAQVPTEQLPELADLLRTLLVALGDTPRRPT